MNGVPAMTIAVSAATGQLGRLALAALKARGHSPVALVRDPARRRGLPPTSAPSTTRPQPRLPPRWPGDDARPDLVQTMWTTVWASTATPFRRQRRRGGRILYTSILRADTSPMLLAADHKATEEAIRDSGLPSPSCATVGTPKTTLAACGGHCRRRADRVGRGRALLLRRARGLCRGDCGSRRRGHEGKVYELAGDTAHSYADLAAEVSRLTGKPSPTTTCRPLPMPHPASFGLPEGFSHVLADSDVQAGKGALYDDSRTLSRLIGRPTTPWQATVAAALA